MLLNWHFHPSLQNIHRICLRLLTASPIPRRNNALLRMVRIVYAEMSLNSALLGRWWILPYHIFHCWNTKVIRHRPRQNVVLTNLGLRLFRIVVKVMMRATVGRVKMEDG